MCFSFEVWSIHRISFNIQDTVNVIRTSFNLFPVAAAGDWVVKWNCFNHSCSIINVDGRLVILNEPALGVLLETMLDSSPLVFQAI